MPEKLNDKTIFSLLEVTKNIKKKPTPKQMEQVLKK